MTQLNKSKEAEALLQAAKKNIADGVNKCYTAHLPVDLIFSTDRPKQTGWYAIIFTPGDSPMVGYIHYCLPDEDDEDQTPYLTWGRSPSDDPESLELDIDKPENIQFSQKLN